MNPTLNNFWTLERLMYDTEVSMAPFRTPCQRSVDFLDELSQLKRHFNSLRSFHSKCKILMCQLHQEAAFVSSLSWWRRALDLDLRYRVIDLIWLRSATVWKVLVLGIENTHLA